jgi:metallo-beta-lactamase family protein
MIKITFTGAAGSVTGSRHLVESNDQKILLDCGLYQGRRKDTYERNFNFPFDPASINTLILSHAHIDHIGNVPNLVKQGFDGDIHCTLATADLVNIMLLDSAHIQESDIRFVNKIRAKHKQPPVDPLYTRIDIPPVISLLHGHSYDRKFKLNGHEAVFREAGHILGAALTVLNLDDQGRKVSLCYTGDLGRPNMPIIRDPDNITDSDVLIVESTYGNRLHRDIKQVNERLADIINETVARGGKIIVPTFALERTQEILYTLHLLRIDHKIPEIPVFVDSPLATNATDIFRLHPECFDDEVNQLLQKEEDPFGFSHLHFTRTTDESKSLNDIDKPIIILAGSGMAESGRILHHLKNNIENPANTVLIVGWQSENTLGRKIQDKYPQVPIFGEFYDLKAQVEVMDEFSAHADRTDLITWISRGKNSWQKVFLVHGEPDSTSSLAQALKENGIKEVIVPKLGESYEL